MSNAFDVTDATFLDVVGTSDVPVLVDFWAPWCGPCRVLGPIVDRVSEHYGERLRVVRVNVDSSPVLSRSYDIRSIPTLMLFRAGESVRRTVGLVRFADLTALIDSELAPTKTAA
ncbi:MAG: thioredoxin [Gemmatimonadaceae bacterium]